MSITMLSSREGKAFPKNGPALKQMQAAVLVSPRRFELKVLPVPEPAPDEVRMKVAYCGICSSNLAPWKGAPWFSYPFPPGVPGHEAVGVVEQLGTNVSGFEVGQHVSMLGNGGFAEYQLAKPNVSSRFQAVTTEFLFWANRLDVR